MPRLTAESLAAAVKPGGGCYIPKFAATLDPEERAVFLEAVELPADQLSVPMLVDLLRDHEKAPTVVQLKNHRLRARACKCPR